jgi:uncharacterized protein (DUF1330 family)
MSEAEIKPLPGIGKIPIDKGGIVMKLQSWKNGRGSRALLTCLFALGLVILTHPSPAWSADGDPACRPQKWHSCHNGPPAYSIVKVSIHDVPKFIEYVLGHMPTLARYGGKFLAATLGAPVQPEVIESDLGSVLSSFDPALPQVMVIHQWPCAKMFHKWYDSEAYAPWKALRHSASRAEVILVEGQREADPADYWPPAFSAVDVEVSNPGVFFGEYVNVNNPAQGHFPTVEKYGGKFIIAGGKVETIEGTWMPKLFVMHRFPSIDLWKLWYNSADYAPWKAKRHSASKADVMLIQGLTEIFKKENHIP